MFGIDKSKRTKTSIRYVYKPREIYVEWEDQPSGHHWEMSLGEGVRGNTIFMRSAIIRAHLAWHRYQKKIEREAGPPAVQL